MNYKMMGRFIAQTLFVEGLFMIPALLISMGYGETRAALAFMYAMAAVFGVAAVLYSVCKGAPSVLNAKSGLVCVGVIWVVLSLFGCVPFVLSGAIPNYVDAFFEIVSGFTTTGSSVLGHPEDLPGGVLYWRSFSHWVGGMGVLVFLLAFAPSGEKGAGFTMHLLRAESPGPTVGKLVPKMRKTASILYVIYLVMTVLDVVLLLLGGMHWLEALCTAFGTVGTGGLGVKSDSMAGYSPYIQTITTVFMFLCGINFSCYYLLLLGQFRSVFKDEELRLYIGITVVSIVLIALDIRELYGTLAETVRHAAFQVTTIMSTTGYGTTDFDLWPSFSKAILMCLMMMGGCAGSTAGGFKMARVLLVFKSLRRNIRKVMHPNTVEVVRTNGQTVEEEVMDNTNAYLAAYVIIMVISVILISMDGFSVTTNITAVFACFNNIGPGLEAVGPTCNYSQFSAFSKIVLSLDMLAGRLEIFPILVLMSRRTWKRS